MYGYIYLTYCKVSGKIYIGQKKSNKFIDTYFGSGKLIQLSINKYGINNFDNYILEWCNTKEELDIREKYWIYKYNSTNRLIGYNISSGGIWGRCNITQETRKKLSEASKGKIISEETRRKISEALKGKTLSNKHRQKLSKAHKGKIGPIRNKICIQKGSLRKYISISDFDLYKKDGWIKGNKKSDIHIKHQSESTKNKYSIKLNDKEKIVTGFSNIQIYLESIYGITIKGTQIKILIKSGEEFHPKWNKFKPLDGLIIKKVR